MNAVAVAVALTLPAGVALGALLAAWTLKTPKEALDAAHRLGRDLGHREGRIAGLNEAADKFWGGQ